MDELVDFLNDASSVGTQASPLAATILPANAVGGDKTFRWVLVVLLVFVVVVVAWQMHKSIGNWSSNPSDRKESH